MILDPAKTLYGGQRGFFRPPPLLGSASDISYTSTPSDAHLYNFLNKFMKFIKHPYHTTHLYKRGGGHKSPLATSAVPQKLIQRWEGWGGGADGNFWVYNKITLWLKSSFIF